VVFYIDTLPASIPFTCNAFSLVHCSVQLLMDSLNCCLIALFCFLSFGLQLSEKHLKEKEQYGLLYQRLRVMPLKLLERVLPWLVAVLSEEQAKEMLQNIRLAGNMLLYSSFISPSVCQG
jgi:hypothetical protein